MGQSLGVKRRLPEGVGLEGVRNVEEVARVPNPEPEQNFH